MNTWGPAMPSFCNETTVEIAIASQLKSLLEADGRKVVPIHFWATREGSRAASAVHADIPFRIIAVFVRRPKLGPQQGVVHGKLNDEIVRFANVARQANIPTVAVFPCARNLIELVGNPPLLFLDIPNKAGDVHFSVQVDVNPRVVSAEAVPLEVAPDIIAERAYQMQAPASLEIWSRTIRQVRQEAPGDKSWLPWGRSVYKPLYLLLADGNAI